MHDIDRTQRELETEAYEHEHEHEAEAEAEGFLGSIFGEAEQENEAFLGSLFGEAEYEHEHEHEHEYEAEAEAEAEYEQEYEHEAESPLSEAQEMELASELLEVSNEAELEQFLGGLFKKAARGIGNFARSSSGRALGGMLKGFAKKALPIAGTALGTAFGGPLGGKIGGGLGRVASGLFELELEGLTHEDREFEVARQFVRLGAAAAKTASRMPKVPPKLAAKRAFVSAARTYAPGLLRRGGATASMRRHSGCRTCAARRRQRVVPRGVKPRKPVIVTRADGTRYVRRPRTIVNGSYGAPSVSYGSSSVVDGSYAEPTYAEPTSGASTGGQWIRRNGHIVLLGA